MDFSWATISFIDIGIFSFGIVAVATGWLVKKRGDKRYNALQERHNALQQAHNALLEQHYALQQEFRDLRKCC